MGIFYLQSTASVYMLIPGLGPLMIVFFGLIMWECAPCCSCRCRLSSGLRKLKPFLDVCEISREEFEQLFQEVIMIQIMSTYFGKSHCLVGVLRKIGNAKFVICLGKKAATALIWTKHIFKHRINFLFDPNLIINLTSLRTL